MYGVLVCANGSRMACMMYTCEEGFDMAARMCRVENGKVKVEIGKNGAVLWKNALSLCGGFEMEQKTAMKISMVSIVGNILLSLFKALAGIVANSGAMISDAIHSASDVFSTIVVIIGIRLSGKESDKEHPYGHERMECVAAILLATILAATGLFYRLVSGRKNHGTG